MLRHKPIVTYNGLTVVLSNPSRFDKSRLLSANGGSLFTRILNKLGTNSMACDVRLKEDESPLLPNTKCILLLGDGAASRWLENTKNTLGEIRGTPYLVKGVPAIASFFPQDCVDRVDLEEKFNSRGDGGTEDDDKKPSNEKRHHGKTSRDNYGFWLRKDVEKCFKIIKNGGVIPKEPEAEYKIYPDLKDILDFLRTIKNTDVFVDIETDAALNITVLAIASPSSPVYVIPFLTHTYQRAYRDLPQILASMAVCFRDNTVVAHNGAAFDFLVFLYKYRLPLGSKLYDTMLAQHRCFPDVEKSLGHCTSLWTWQPFHKDEADFSLSSFEAAQRLWAYCGKDVHTMRLIKSAIDSYSKTVPGLPESIAQVSASIRPYLLITLTGLYYKQEWIDETVKENDRLMMQYTRCIELLIGKEWIKEIKGSGKSSMPGSNPQCVRYFHNLLNYPVVAYGKPKLDGTKSPSLGKNAMFKLKLKHNNPVIDFVLAYRNKSHETGSLKFTPYVKATTEVQPV